MKRFNIDPKKQIAAEIAQHSKKDKRMTTASKHKEKIRKNQINHILKLIPSAKTVLCVGCRDDSEVIQFNKAGLNAVGIDIANESNYIKKLDAHKMLEEFEPNSFDIVFSSHSLEHMHDPYKVLSNIRKVATKGLFIALPLPHATGEATIASINHPAIFDIMTEDIASLKDLKEHKFALNDFESLKPYNVKWYKRRNQAGLPKEVYVLFGFE